MLFQDQLREAVSVPVFSSSLMLIPFIASTVAKGRRVGVITAEAASLSARHLLAAAIDSTRFMSWEWTAARSLAPRHGTAS